MLVIFSRSLCFCRCLLVWEFYLGLLLMAICMLYIFLFDVTYVRSHLIKSKRNKWNSHIPRGRRSTTSHCVSFPFLCGGSDTTTIATTTGLLCCTCCGVAFYVNCYIECKRYNVCDLWNKRRRKKKRRLLKIHLRIIDSFPIIVYLLPPDFLFSKRKAAAAIVTPKINSFIIFMLSSNHLHLWWWHFSCALVAYCRLFNVCHWPD